MIRNGYKIVNDVRRAIERPKARMEFANGKMIECESVVAWFERSEPTATELVYAAESIKATESIKTTVESTKTKPAATKR